MFKNLAERISRAFQHVHGCRCQGTSGIRAAASPGEFFMGPIPEKFQNPTPQALFVAVKYFLLHWRFSHIFKFLVQSSTLLFYDFGLDEVEIEQAFQNIEIPFSLPHLNGNYLPG